MVAAGDLPSPPEAAVVVEGAGRLGTEPDSPGAMGWNMALDKLTEYLSS